MKTLIYTLLFIFASTAADAQVYRIEEVWSSSSRMLVCRKDASLSTGHHFVLCDVKYYTEGSDNPFLSVYFEGDAGRMAGFLSEVADFADRFAGQDGIMTEIEGCKVVRVKKASGSGIYIFEQGGRHFGGYSDRDLVRLQECFEHYCERENII